jgi:(1->4)-alpha-D-glucan 1-alpha-D-glucosylmutase
MHIPVSTYRVQLHKEFTFRDLDGILDYLYRLGVSTIYAAPILKSTPGSVHGYDVIDPHTIDPEIGTLDEFRLLAVKLKERGMSWLQDIVPNHMAFHVLNFRLMDVLERGPDSPYYNYFDIDWNHPTPALKGKVCAPFLGNELDKCIVNKEVKISFSENGFTVDYFDTSYPLSLSAYEFIFPKENAHLLDGLNELKDKSKSLADLTAYKTYKADWCKKMKDKKSDIARVLDSLNDRPSRLRKVLDHQFYQLMYWKGADQEINYRRFFTVSELICLRMEDDEVFGEYHQFIHRLYNENLIQGVRIDHIDGLYDPSAYTKNLRKLLGESCYIIAEKILEAKEDLPECWPLQGTSGYEFLSHVNQLITDKQGAKKMVRFYKELLPEIPAYKQLVFNNKTLMLERYMRGEWDNLIHYFNMLKLQHNYDGTRIKEALKFFMLSLPVYRIYPNQLPLQGRELEVIEDAFAIAASQCSSHLEELNYLRLLFTTKPSHPDAHDRIVLFLKRLMQFTGPLTAKGVEDTTFYVYNALVSHDEVGDAPSTLGISVQTFHAKMKVREELTPLSLNATATHDTKRGEDARLRLNVLSELPEVWQNHVQQWLTMNECCRVYIHDKQAPSLNDEYFMYQAILGGFPEDLKVTDQWIERLKAYLLKAMREAKTNTNWAEPDEEYERACLRFVEDILKEEHTFLKSFIPLMEIVSRYANLYALAQVLIKITAPGIPDIYQGCELWDFSFVDPDNRRPIDYTKRNERLKQIIQKEEDAQDVLFSYLKSGRHEGMEKLYVTACALNFRKKKNELFKEGTYIPLQVTGKESIVLAYARCKDEQWVVVVIPLALAKNRETDQPYIEDPTDKRYIILPDEAPQQWTNVFTGEILQTVDQLSIFECFKDFPLALFTSS